MKCKEVFNNNDLEIRLKACKHLVFDADDTLVHTDPAYYQIVTREMLKMLNYQPLDIASSVQTARAISELQEKLGINRDIYWSAFRQVDNYETRLSYVKVFPDVKALKLLTDKQLYMVTHAPSELAYAYAEKIEEQTGVKFPYVHSIYHYGENAQKMVKPTPRLLYDLMTELSLMEPLKPPYEYRKNFKVRRPVFNQTAIIGDSIIDIGLAHNTGSVGVWVDRPEFPSPIPPFPHIRVENLEQLVILLNKQV